jgi:hypothetical protein
MLMFIASTAPRRGPVRGGGLRHFALTTAAEVPRDAARPGPGSGLPAPAGPAGRPSSAFASAWLSAWISRVGGTNWQPNGE